MLDPIASFPFQNATTSELSTAIGNAIAEFEVLQSQATIISKFVTEANTVSLRQQLSEEARNGILMGESLGLFRTTSPGPIGTPQIINSIVEHQVATADYGAKLAAIVLLHNGVERFFWRLVRFGIVANRPKALERIGGKRITVNDLQAAGPDAVIDSLLEDWWNTLERESLIQKWDCLCDLVGYPTKLNDPPSWSFNRDNLIRFDEVRINAVHHDGSAIKLFDLTEFSNQLHRAQLVWLVQVCKALSLQITAEAFAEIRIPAS